VLENDVLLDLTMSLLHIANNTSSGDLPPCPVPDWTNMVVRAYTPEERQAIHDWYAVQDGNETIADMENRIPIKTQADLDRIYQIGNGLFSSSDEIDEMVAPF
jgi:hypothetical protein